MHGVPGAPADAHQLPAATHQLPGVTVMDTPLPSFPDTEDVDWDMDETDDDEGTSQIRQARNRHCRMDETDDNEGKSELRKAVTLQNGWYCRRQRLKPK